MDVVREFRTAAVRLHVLRHHGHQIGPGTLYPLLHRMDQAGLPTSQQQVVNGRHRRPYRATEQVLTDELASAIRDRSAPGSEQHE